MELIPSSEMKCPIGLYGLLFTTVIIGWGESGKAILNKTLLAYLQCKLLVSLCWQQQHAICQVRWAVFFGCCQNIFRAKTDQHPWKKAHMPMVKTGVQFQAALSEDWSRSCQRGTMANAQREPTTGLWGAETTAQSKGSAPGVGQGACWKPVVHFHTKDGPKVKDLTGRLPCPRQTAASLSNDQPPSFGQWTGVPPGLSICGSVSTLALSINVRVWWDPDLQWIYAKDFNMLL